jgi:phosphomevalonate kinase
MVTVKEIKKAENSNGEEFYGLIVQSGAIPVKSKKTGKIYFTAKTAFVSTTFDEKTASSLIGMEFEGTIKKVETDPYEYIIEQTGEVIQLSHRWEYVDPALEMEEQLVKEAIVL